LVKVMAAPPGLEVWGSRPAAADAWDRAVRPHDRNAGREGTYWGQAGERNPAATIQRPRLLRAEPSPGPEEPASLIERGLQLVASGAAGFGLTDTYDCNVWALTGAFGTLLSDAGAGRAPDAVLAAGRAGGLDWPRPVSLLLTHAHAGGAAALRERLRARAHAGAQTARWVATGDCLFHGGKVVWQDTWDCNVQATAASLRKRAGITFDTLLPGHPAFNLGGAIRHLQAAIERLGRLLLPISLI
jgi:hypothetical protein